MSIFETILNTFNNHLENTSRNIESVTPHIAEAAHLLAESLTNEKKILCCTSSTSFAAGQQFCHNLSNSLDLQRPALPAIFLNSNSSGILATHDNKSGNDFFAQQVHALGNKEDVLVIISSSSDEQYLIEAISAADDKGMAVVALLSNQHNAIAEKINHTNVVITLQAETSKEIINIHYFISVLLSSLIEQQLFGTV
jgi:D-sedoheptulose 7-phosphate isomerase